MSGAQTVSCKQWAHGRLHDMPRRNGVRRTNRIGQRKVGAAKAAISEGTDARAGR